MKRPTPASRALASRLIEHEASGSAAADDRVAASGRVLARLRRIGQQLVGGRGMTVLERRAVDLAASDHRVLGELLAAPEAIDLVDWVRERANVVEPEGKSAAIEAVLGQLLDLLAAFLGGDIRDRLIRRAWPDLPDENPPDRPRDMR